MYTDGCCPYERNAELTLYHPFTDAGSAWRMRRREDQPVSPARTRLRRQGSPCLLPPSVSYYFIALSITSLHSKPSLNWFSFLVNCRSLSHVHYISLNCLSSLHILLSFNFLEETMFVLSKVTTFSYVVSLLMSYQFLFEFIPYTFDILTISF
jgi:hypothetical protein